MGKSSDIPYGYCHCGCGQKTSIPSVNNAFFGYKKGQPLEFVHGHNRHPVTPKDRIPPDPNPSGLCMCGCGKKTEIIKRTQIYRGRFVGHHFQFYHGHNRRKSKTSPDKKPCSRCKSIKAKDEFYNDKRYPDGLSCLCKECIRSASKANYHEITKNGVPHDMYEKQKETRLRWKETHRERYTLLGRINKLVRRAREKNVPTERIDPLIVYKSHNGICGLCHKPVSIKNFHVDHIIPLSKGGHHIYSNVQPAHPLCNLKKHNRIDFELSSIELTTS